jgi:diadenosine tetraphosphate (Ap4A) HIT family hydrolase
MGFHELEKEELAALGKNISGLEKGLRAYWLQHFPNDRLELVYAIHFFESQFDPNEHWHMHVHIIPRFESLKLLMPYKSGAVGADAWKIPTVEKQEGFPRQYQIRETALPRNFTPDDRIKKLMAWLAPYLHYRAGLNPND